MLIEIGKASHQNSIELLRDNAGGGAPVRYTSDQDLSRGRWKQESPSTPTTVERYDRSQDSFFGGTLAHTDELVYSISNEGHLNFEIVKVYGATAAEAGRLAYRGRNNFIPAKVLTFGAFVFPLVDNVTVEVRRRIDDGLSTVVEVSQSAVPGQWNRVCLTVSGRSEMELYRPVIQGTFLLALPAMVSGEIAPGDWGYFPVVGERVEMPI